MEEFSTEKFDPKTRARVYVRARMFPGIGISRSLGDFMAHKIGVISEPTTGLVQLSKINEFLVIATSTLWSVMTPKEVFDFIRLN